jgi:hypothetical protein
MNGGQGGGYGIAEQLALEQAEEDEDEEELLDAGIQGIERVTAEHRVVQAASSPGSMRPQVQQLYSALRRLASSRATTSTAAGTGGNSSSLGGRLAAPAGGMQLEEEPASGGSMSGSHGVKPAPAAAASSSGAAPASNPQQQQQQRQEPEVGGLDLMDWFEERVEEEEAVAAAKPFELPGEDFVYRGNPQVGKCHTQWSRVAS